MVWDSLFPAAMKAQLQCHFSFNSQRNEIPGEIESLKAIASLEVTQAIIEPKRIHKIGDSFLRAALHGFGQ